MSKKYNSQSTIDDILSVSAKLFLEKGFDKTSMNDIATTAGISKGAPRELLCEDKAVSLSERNGINAIRQDRQ